MLFQQEIPRLRADDIEVKVKKVTANGAIALLYKTARTDMKILDECAGPENWQDEYHEIKGNLYCTIKVRNPETGEWIGKTDCGIESREDDEGNQKKGEASDAFKRAGFKWGIGRELYTAPFIFLNVPTKKVEGSGKPRYELENTFARFSVKSISYDDDGAIRSVVIVDDKGKQVFPVGKQEPKKQDMRDKVTIDQINELSFELQRTGWNVQGMLDYINKKLGYSYKRIEDLTFASYKFILPALKGKPDKAAQ